MHSIMIHKIIACDYNELFPLGLKLFLNNSNAKKYQEALKEWEFYKYKYFQNGSAPWSKILKLFKNNQQFIKILSENRNDFFIEIKGKNSFIPRPKIELSNTVWSSLPKKFAKEKAVLLKFIEKQRKGYECSIHAHHAHHVYVLRNTLNGNKLFLGQDSAANFFLPQGVDLISKEVILANKKLLDTYREHHCNSEAASFFVKYKMDIQSAVFTLINYLALLKLTPILEKKLLLIKEKLKNIEYQRIIYWIFNDITLIKDSMERLSKLTPLLKGRPPLEIKLRFISENYQAFFGENHQKVPEIKKVLKKWDTLSQSNLLNDQELVFINNLYKEMLYSTSVNNTTIHQQYMLNDKKVAKFIHELSLKKGLLAHHDYLFLLKLANTFNIDLNLQDPASLAENINTIVKKFKNEKSEKDELLEEIKIEMEGLGEYQQDKELTSALSKAIEDVEAGKTLTQEEWQRLKSLREAMLLRNAKVIPAQHKVWFTNGIKVIADHLWLLPTKRHNYPGQNYQLSIAEIIKFYKKHSTLPSSSFEKIKECYNYYFKTTTTKYHFSVLEKALFNSKEFSNTGLAKEALLKYSTRYGFETFSELLDREELTFKDYLSLKNFFQDNLQEIAVFQNNLVHLTETEIGAFDAKYLDLLKQSLPKEEYALYERFQVLPKDSIFFNEKLILDTQKLQKEIAQYKKNNPLISILLDADTKMPEMQEIKIIHRTTAFDKKIAKKSYEHLLQFLKNPYKYIDRKSAEAVAQAISEKKLFLKDIVLNYFNDMWDAAFIKLIELLLQKGYLLAYADIPKSIREKKKNLSNKFFNDLKNAIDHSYEKGSSAYREALYLLEPAVVPNTHGFFVYVDPEKKTDVYLNFNERFYGKKLSDLLQTENSLIENLLSDSSDYPAEVKNFLKTSIKSLSA